MDNFFKNRTSGAFYVCGVKNFKNIKYKNCIFGVILQDTPLLSRPTTNKKLSLEGFNLYAESLCRTCEVVIIATPFPINGFYKVLTKNSHGFIKKTRLGKISRKTALSLLSSKRLVYITEHFVTTFPNKNPKISKVSLSFGSIIPYVKAAPHLITLLLPLRTKSGLTRWVKATVSRSGFCRLSPVYPSSKNIIALCKKLLSMPYDWGESFGGYDCSGLVSAVFSLCKIPLPRNTDQFLEHPLSVDVSSVNTKFLNLCRPGDLLISKGHIMVYYTKIRNIPFVIHAFYGNKKKVTISPLSALTSSGKPLYKDIIKILPIFSLTSKTHFKDFSLDIFRDI